MNKRERMQAVLQGKPVDRTALSFWCITQRSTIAPSSSPRPSFAGQYPPKRVR